MPTSYRKPVLLTSVLKNFQFQLQATGTLNPEIHCESSFQTDCSTNPSSTCDQFGFLPIVEVRYFVADASCSSLHNGNDCSVSIDGVVVDSSKCSASFEQTGTDCGGGCLVDLICTSFHDVQNQIPCVDMTEASFSCPGITDSCQTTVQNITGS